MKTLPPEEEADRIQALTQENRRLQQQLKKLAHLGDGYQDQLRTLNGKLKTANEELAQALAEVKTLRGLVPICARCKRIRDDRGLWEQIENYVARHSEATFSHGLCPECAALLFPKVAPSQEKPRTPVTPATLEPDITSVRTRLDALKENPDFRDHPLMGELERMAEAQVWYLRRMDKITRISDQFQGQLKELSDSYQRASRIDILTGLPNRRAILEELQSEMARILREPGSLAVIMVDVDRFKNINDTFGHDVGDRVLHVLAEAMQDSLRAYDLCARWGGEEFLVVLPGTDRAGALRAGEKLRDAVARMDVTVGPDRVAATISLGVAVLEERETLDAVIHRADAAMYDAKRQGGDRIVA